MERMTMTAVTIRRTDLAGTIETTEAMEEKARPGGESWQRNRRGKGGDQP